VNEAKDAEAGDACKELSQVDALLGASGCRGEATAAWRGMKTHLVPEGYARSSEDGLRSAQSAAELQQLVTHAQRSRRRV
jgi:hypothetical protein